MSDATDPELARLLDIIEQGYFEAGRFVRKGRLGSDGFARAIGAHDALLAHLARPYTRVTELAGPGFDGPIPDDPPDTIPAGYRAARGAAPWRPGMPTPEDAIRRLRDGEDAPETEHWPDPPIVAGPKARIPVTIRAGGPARAIRYEKETLTDG